MLARQTAEARASSDSSLAVLNVSLKSTAMIMKEVVAQSVSGQWQKGHIVSIRGEGLSMEVKVHFHDTEPHLDEWIIYKSRRIQEVIDLLLDSEDLNNVVPQYAKVEPSSLVR